MRSLFDLLPVESVEEINATYWGADSAVFTKGEHQQPADNVGSDSLVFLKVPHKTDITNTLL